MKGGKMVNGSNGKLDLLSNCAFFLQNMLSKIFWKYNVMWKYSDHVNGSRIDTIKSAAYFIECALCSV